jgi:hypothetical protein
MRTPTSWLVVAVAIAAAGSAGLAGARERRIVVAAAAGDSEVLVRSGRWRDRQGAIHRWRARLERRGETLRGEATIDGAAPAMVEGRIRRDSLSGTVTDAAGRKIATFTGKLKGDSASGSYRAASGERGSWSSP